MVRRPRVILYVGSLIIAASLHEQERPFAAPFCIQTTSAEDDRVGSSGGFFFRRNERKVMSLLQKNIFFSRKFVQDLSIFEIIEIFMLFHIKEHDFLVAEKLQQAQKAYIFFKKRFSTRYIG
jgi:hypothetical protein